MDATEERGGAVTGDGAVAGAPGRLVSGLPFAEYRALPGLNWSALKHMRKSPLHYRHAAVYREPVTAAMGLGQLVHAMVLEPATVANRFRVYSGRRAGKAWDDFEASATADAAEVVLEKDWVAAEAAAAAVASNTAASGLMSRVRDSEVSCFWERRERRYKARFDAIGEGFVLDIKTASTLDPRTFGGQCARLGYHNQAAFYLDGYRAATGEAAEYFVLAVESAEPHDVCVYRMPAAVIAAGREENATLVSVLADCETRNEWPGRCAEIVDLPFPEWGMGEEFGLTIDGEEI